MALFLGGLILGLASLLAVLLMEGGSVGAIIGPSAFVLAVLGPFGATLMGAGQQDVRNLPKALVIAMKGRTPDADAVITLLGRFADRARREGMLVLESELPEVEDHFLRTGLQLVVDGVDGDHVRGVLEAELDAMRERHHALIRFFHTMAGFAPIFGLMGTIVGIVGVMGKLEEPADLGHGIALALLGVLYGVLFGNLVYLPIANKLERLHNLETEARRLTLEGILAIREGMSARLLVERLEARLAPERRVGHQQRFGHAVAEATREEVA